MATKEFVSLEGLAKYHELISQVISDGDASAIQSISVNGNTVNFYKNTTATGTPAYSVNMPDVSGFMSKIASATGGKITVSDANGGVVESALTVADVTGKMNKISGATGNNIVVSNSDGSVRESSLSDLRIVTGYTASTSFATGNLVVGANNNLSTKDSGISVNDIATQSDIADLVDDIADKMDKGTSWEGGKVVVSSSDGSVSESNISSLGLVTGYTDSTQLFDGHIVIGGENDDLCVTDSGVSINDVSTSLAATEGFDGDNTIADAIDALSDDVADKMDKLTNPTGNYIVTSTSSGNVAESSVRFSDLASMQYVGEIPVSSQATTVVGYIGEVEDAADGKITKIASATGGKIATTTSGGEVAESGTAISDLATNAFVGSIPSGATATTVVGYVDEAVDAVADDSEVTLVEAQTPTTGYLKTYELYQGGNAAANLVGKIDIPKDLVVTSGEIVVNPTGQPAGTYLKLTIANQTAPVYINVADLCDAYTAASGATQVQLAISATNEISATLVAGGVGTTELAGSAVTTAKIADDAVTAAKVSIAAHTESKTAGADGIAVSVTTTDGQVSSVNASIAANTYDAYGAASTAESNANAYTDAATAAVAISDIEALFS